MSIFFDLCLLLVSLLLPLVMFFADMLAILLTMVLSGTFLTGHTKGLTRFFHGLSALTALHLLTGIVLPMMSGKQGYLLSPIFSGGVMVASLCLLFLSITAPIAVNSATNKSRPDTQDSVVGINKSTVEVISYLFSVAIVIGGISLWSTTSTRSSLIDQICAEVDGTATQTWIDRGTKAIEFADGLTERAIQFNVPCAKNENSS